MRPTIQHARQDPSPSLRFDPLHRATAILGVLLQDAAPEGSPFDDPEPRDWAAVIESLNQVQRALARQLGAHTFEGLLFEHPELGPRVQRLVRSKRELLARVEHDAHRLAATRRARWGKIRRELARLADALGRHVTAERAIWGAASAVDLGEGD